MNEIYLLTYDGYLDSTNLENFATNKEELIAIVKKDMRERFSANVIDAVVDFDKKEIHFKTDALDDLEEWKFEFHIIKKIETL